MIQVQEIIVYPIKSLRGISLDRWSVDLDGLRFDRQWMLVDGTGEFMSQRKLAKMALIDTAIGADGLIARCGDREIVIPIDPEGARRQVKVWNDLCEAVEVKTEVSDWFVEVLGTPCALVKMPEVAVRKGFADAPIRFSDSNPILIVSQASLDDLNGKLAHDIPMRRFRPNIVVTGDLPFAEDEWTQVRIGEVSLARSIRAGRCVVTTIDIDTAKTSDEPLRTLATYRHEGKHVWFGCFYRPCSAGEIAVAMKVRAT